jgi:hypothetical protein
MPLELGQFAVMEYLWDTLEKTPDGKAIRYTLADIEMLWAVGFVDTQQYPLDEWKRVFEQFLQADGTFLLGKAAFLGLDKYRYKGEIHIPFDAMRINEGLYTDEGFQELIDASIAPSCSLASEQLKAYFTEFKDLFRTPDGLIKISVEAKQRIRELLDRNSSPLRNLELLFDEMLAVGMGKEMEKKVEGSQTEMATARAAIEASSFTAAPTSRAEAAAKGLRGLEKAKKGLAAHKDETSGVSLKKIRRSRKGMRG